MSSQSSTSIWTNYFLEKGKSMSSNNLREKKKTRSNLHLSKAFDDFGPQQLFFFFYWSHFGIFLIPLNSYRDELSAARWKLCN